MKKQIVVVVFILCIVTQAYAQAPDSKPQRFAAYEHHVKPSMNEQYWECMKKVKENSMQHKINMSWVSVSMDDNTFIHFVPIKGFADLDKDFFEELGKKMGKESYGAMWSAFDPCIESSTSYVVTSYPALSYKTAPADENFRDVMFWEVLPGKEKEAEEVLKGWAKLYDAKKVPVGFETLKITFGERPMDVLAAWGKDEADLATRFKKAQELLGEDLGKMWNKTMSITQRYYSKRGNILPNVCYSLASN